MGVSSNLAALHVADDASDRNRRESPTLPSSDHLEVTKASTLEAGSSTPTPTSGVNLQDSVDSAEPHIQSTDHTGTCSEVTALFADGDSLHRDEGSEINGVTYMDEDHLPSDILPLKQLRDATLKLVPSEELEPDFIPSWYPDGREEFIRKRMMACLDVIDERSWLLLRNHIKFYFVSSRITLWQSNIYFLLV